MVVLNIAKEFPEIRKAATNIGNWSTEPPLVSVGWAPSRSKRGGCDADLCGWLVSQQVALGVRLRQREIESGFL